MQLLNLLFLLLGSSSMLIRDSSEGMGNQSKRGINSDFATASIDRNVVNNENSPRANTPLPTSLVDANAIFDKIGESSANTDQRLPNGQSILPSTVQNLPPSIVQPTSTFTTDPTSIDTNLQGAITNNPQLMGAPLKSTPDLQNARNDNGAPVFNSTTFLILLSLIIVGMALCSLCMAIRTFREIQNDFGKSDIDDDNNTLCDEMSFVEPQPTIPETAICLPEIKIPGHLKLIGRSHHLHESHDSEGGDNGKAETSSGTDRKAETSSSVTINNNGDTTSSTVVTGDGGTFVNVNTGGVSVSSSVILSDAKDKVDDKIPVVTVINAINTAVKAVTTTTTTATTFAAPVEITTLAIVIPNVQTIAKVESTALSSSILPTSATSIPTITTTSSPDQNTVDSNAGSILMPLITVVTGVLIVSSLALLWVFWPNLKRPSPKMPPDSTSSSLTLSNEASQKDRHSQQDLNAPTPAFPVSPSTTEATPTDQLSPVVFSPLHNTHQNEDSIGDTTKEYDSSPTDNMEQGITTPKAKSGPEHKLINRSLLAILTTRLSNLSFRWSRSSTPNPSSVSDNLFKANHISVESEESLSKYLE
ncbi:hypothetical protein HK103_006418 [Boothiomyces macroporosus]|uniref:Uncharacterized protein n=1 Tax=Boothiomyces macroporosus TaxID=261099 RepID=A0AAD5UL99_9FUNG|nr:hypothetical protein HK103_006418 [Boothiomyces macroporosus]